MIRSLLFSLLFSLLALPLTAEIRSEKHLYQHGDVPMEAVVYWDASLEGQRPAVMIVHQWMGISEHETAVAHRLAEMGFVAFCVDIYGRDNRPTSAAEAGKLAGQFREADRVLLRQRLMAGLSALRSGFTDRVDNSRIVAIGYCFGGTAVLELARLNADVMGVVSFHGGLSKGTGGTAADLKPEVLILHGEADPYVPAADVTGVVAELKSANAKFEFVSYSGAVHSFTDRGANSEGAKYDPRADRRSWERLNGFLEELFTR